jgi:arginyl-tRNA synthetase
MKSDGSYTYFAADMAYHHNKLARGFRHLINVFGADHAGYLTRVKAAVAALSDGKADLDIKVCQLVRLFRAGEPVKMSKREGTFVCSAKARAMSTPQRRRTPVRSTRLPASSG